ncbi:MAG: hypothetical protein WAO78_02825 [Roseovarius sp.]
MTFDLLFAGLVSLLVITAIIAAFTGRDGRDRRSGTNRKGKGDPER